MIHFLLLPDELQLEIARFWDFQSLCRVACCSTYTKQLSNKEELWENQLRKLCSTDTMALIHKKVNKALDQLQSKSIFMHTIPHAPRWFLLGQEHPAVRTDSQGFIEINSESVNEAARFNRLLFMNQTLFTSGKHYFELHLPKKDVSDMPHFRVGFIMDSEHRCFGLNFNIDMNAIFLPKPPAIYDVHSGLVQMFNLLPTWSYTYSLYTLERPSQGAIIGVYIDVDSPIIAFSLHSPDHKKGVVICVLHVNILITATRQGFRPFIEANGVNGEVKLRTDFAAKVPSIILDEIKAQQAETETEAAPV